MILKDFSSKLKCKLTYIIRRTKVDKNSKGFLYLINTALEAAILAGAIIMFVVGKVPLVKILNQAQPVWIQAGAGILAGVLTGVLCGMLVTKVKFFNPVLEMIGELVSKYKFNTLDIIIISLTAAVCEEFLFRAGLQRIWGIWPASVLFILLHGYFNVRNLKIMAYGIIMLLLSAAIGYSYQYLGLYAAIAFHFIFDVAALMVVSNSLKTQDSSPK